MLQCDHCGKQTRELCTVLWHPPRLFGCDFTPYFDICRECFDIAEERFAREVGAPPRLFVATIQYHGALSDHAVS